MPVPKPSARHLELKLDHARLEEAPSPPQRPQVGEWGRGSELPTPPQGLAFSTAPIPPADGVPGQEFGEQSDSEFSVGETEGAHAYDAEHGDDDRENAAERDTPEPALDETGRLRKVGPPQLASEAMRREMRPSEPATLSSRVALALLGALGAVSSLLLLGSDGFGLPLSGAFVLALLLGVVPMPYPARAAVLVTLAGAGLAIVSLQGLDRAEALVGLVLMFGITILATALFFRAWHRGSLLARALITLGIAICVGWLWMGQGLTALAILETDWHRWLPPVLQVPLALILMLCLLAFMDARSTGGCTVWAWLLLLWFATHSAVGLVAAADAAGGGLVGLPEGVIAAAIGQPLFTALLTLGLAQLLAVSSAR